MTILFVGDVVGRPGRRAARVLLPRLIVEHRADFVIVNAENSASGYGITEGTVEELIGVGADCLTTGNHVWAQKQAFDLVERERRVLRPANYPPGAPGSGAEVYETPLGESIGVINLVGRVFMDPMDCPFRAAEEHVEALADRCDAIVVDIHAEATSEKIAMGYYLDGRVTAVIGTHTHVQTADEEILPGGTAFISDAGMTGPVGTVLGVKQDIVIHRLISRLPIRFEVPKRGPAILCGVVIETQPGTMSAHNIKRLRILTDEAEEVS